MSDQQSYQYNAAPNSISSVRKWVGIGCLALLVLGVSCGGLFAFAYSRGTASATPAVDAFFADVKNSDSAKLWTSAHPEFRKVATQAQVDAILKRIDAAMGPLQSQTRTGANVSNNNGVSSVRFTYTATFANGPADAVVVVTKSGGKYQLLSFNFNSPQIAASPACPQCGTANLSGTKFCGNCGAPLTAAPAVDGDTSATLQAENSEP